MTWLAQGKQVGSRLEMGTLTHAMGHIPTEYKCHMPISFELGQTLYPVDEFSAKLCSCHPSMLDPTP